MFKRFNILLVHHCESASVLESVWTLVLEKLHDANENLSITGRLVEICTILATVDAGKKILDRKLLFKAIEGHMCRLFSLDSLSQYVNDSSLNYCRRELVKLFCSTLETASLESSVVYSRKALDVMFNCPLEVFCVFDYCFSFSRI